MHGMRTGASAGLIRKLAILRNFWGRSIGWWFMALVDALEYIPQDHSGYADMIKWTKELAETLSKYQDKNGLWYQVIDQPSRTVISRKLLLRRNVCMPI